MSEVRWYYEEDVPPGALEGETVAILGYGIQGRAQAANLRDSGVPVLVGNVPDAYRHEAEADGFTVLYIAEAVRRATVTVVLLPDEVQPALFPRDVAPGLAPGDAVVFAHGFATALCGYRWRRDSSARRAALPRRYRHDHSDSGIHSSRASLCL